MDTSKTFRRVLLLSSLLVVSSAVAAGVYIQTSKSQKKPKDHSSGYDAATVTEAPEVRSLVKGLDITTVTLIDQGTPQAAIVIDVTNQRDEDVMAVDFESGVGKNTSAGISLDGLAADEPLVIIPRHSLKSFTWHLGEILQGETAFLAVAVFSDGKEEGDKQCIDRLKQSRIQYQEKRRAEKARNGGQQ
jgi:hypothetical protein